MIGILLTPELRIVDGRNCKGEIGQSLVPDLKGEIGQHLVHRAKGKIGQSPVALTGGGARRSMSPNGSSMAEESDSQKWFAPAVSSGWRPKSGNGGFGFPIVLLKGLRS